MGHSHVITLTIYEVNVVSHEGNITNHQWLTVTIIYSVSVHLMVNVSPRWFIYNIMNLPALMLKSMAVFNTPWANVNAQLIDVLDCNMNRCVCFTLPARHRVAVKLRVKPFHCPLL